MAKVSAKETDAHSAFEAGFKCGLIVHSKGKVNRQSPDEEHRAALSEAWRNYWGKKTNPWQESADRFEKKLAKTIVAEAGGAFIEATQSHDYAAMHVVFAV